MKQYHDLLEKVLTHGESRIDRTNTGTLSLFGEQLKFDLRDGFPAITTKKLAWKAVVSELLWFLEGSNDERRLAEILFDKKRDLLVDKKTIWTENALSWEGGKNYPIMGNVYGKQLRFFNGNIDQFKGLIDSITENPYSRRHFISFWNPSDVDSNNLALPPCHVTIQMYISNSNDIDCHFYMRSNDLFLGAPFNIASYALFTHIVGSITGYKPRYLIQSIGDAHIYSNHIDQVKEQLSRKEYELPTLELPNSELLKKLITFDSNVGVSDFKLQNYQSHPAILGKMAV